MIQNGYARLRRVLVRPPDTDAADSWERYGWHRPPDVARAIEEHERFRSILADAGAEVIVSQAPVPGDPDAVYAYDPLLLTNEGSILLRPGKEGRRAEPEALARDVNAAGIPIAGRLEAPATAEGGDLCFLDERTLLAGIGYRTNEAAISQLRRLLPEVDVVAFDLPHLGGPSRCLHLMSFLSPLDADLVVAYPPLMPVRLLQLLADRAVDVVEVPEPEFASMGPNVLALGPREALSLEGNPETERRMQAAGVTVRTYAGDEISRNGDGGPTCLTRPLLRG